MDDAEYVDDELAELERQINALDGDHDDAPPSSNKPNPKAPGKQKKPADEYDFDDLDALEKHIAEMSDEDDGSKPKPKPVEPIAVKPPPPKPVAKPTVAAPPPADDDDDEPKDENGVPESTLVEEEPLYHSLDKIMSVDSLTHEDEHYHGRILDGELIGSDYRDVLDTDRTERQNHMTKLTKAIESGKLSVADYAAIVQRALGDQQMLLKAAVARKASVTTRQRLQKRIELMTAEIKILSENLGGEEGEVAEEKPTAPVSAAAAEKLPPVNASNSKKPVEAGAKAQSEMPSGPKQYKVPEEKLEEMSKTIIQHAYYSFYKEKAGSPVAPEQLQKLKSYTSLFKDPYSITAANYKEVMQNLGKITKEMVLGCTVEERVNEIEEMEKQALTSIDQMKALACDKPEYLPTVQLIKYIKSIKANEDVPVPKVTSSNIEKMWKGPFNNAVPQNILRIYFDKLTGAAGHRKFYLTLGINYSGSITTVDTPWVVSCDKEQS